MKRIIFLTFSFLFSICLFAQNEGIGINPTGSDPNPSAMLDVQSTNKGLLIPRLTREQRDAIVSPAAGLYVFNLEDSCFNYYTGYEWLKDCGRSLSADPLIGNTAQSSSNSTFDHVAQAPDGDLYLSGKFTSSLTLGEISLSNGGTTEQFVCRYDPNSQTFLWAEVISGASSLTPFGLVSDGSGNLFLASAYNGTISAGSLSINIPSGTNQVLFKIDSNGQFLWAESSSNGFSDGAIATDASGNVFLSSRYNSAITLSGQNIPTPSGNDFYLAKYDGAGSLQWIQNGFNTSGAGILLIQGLDTDASGNLYLSGMSLGATGLTLGSDVLPGGVGLKGFVGKFDPSGSDLWGSYSSGVGNCQLYGLIATPTGEVYVSGSYDNTIDLGGITMPVSAGAYDGLIAKIDGSGNFSWAKSLSSTASFSPFHLASNGSGGVVISGRFSSPMTLEGTSLTPTGFDSFVASLDDLGSLQWAAQSGGSQNELLNDIAYISEGKIFAIGAFNSAPASFGSQEYSPKGGEDGFIWPLDAGTGGDFVNTGLSGAQDGDRDASNELQQISISGNTISISKGNSLDLSPINTDAQSLSLLGSDLSISNGNTIDLSSIDTDTDEQTLGLSGNNLSISNGNTVNLSSIDTNTDEQTLSLSGNQLSISGGNSVNISSLTTDTDSQTLSIKGSKLTISNGNTIDISQNVISDAGLVLDSCVLSNFKDIDQYSGGGFAVTASGWQGFQVSKDGFLQRFDAWIQNGYEVDGYVRVYEGEGTNGALLYESIVSNELGPFVFPPYEIPVLQDSIYTVELTDTLGSMGWIFPGGNSYLLSTSNIGQDYNFKVYLDTCSSVQVLGVNANGELSFNPVEQIVFADGSVQTTAPKDEQDLTLLGNQLSISNGNSVNLPVNNDNDPTNELQDWTTLPNIPSGFADDVDNVDDADNDPTNELQDWTTLPNIPAGFSDDIDHVDDADNDPTNELQDWTTLPNIPAGFSDNIDHVDDADNDPTNELQDWTTLPNIPAGFLDNIDHVDDADNDPTNELQDWMTLPNIPAGFADDIDHVDDADNDPINELQLLSFSEDTLFISNGNKVALDTLGDELGDHKATENLQMQGHWVSHDGDNEGIWIDPDGRVGIGTSAPLEQLEVNGALKLANTTSLHPGTIRYTNNDFEGYNGTEWKSLTESEFRETATLLYNHTNTPEALDVSIFDPTSNGVSNSLDNPRWQSFTPSSDGYLSRIEIMVYDDFGSTTQVFDVKIYKGEGTGGQLLFSKTVLVPVGAYGNQIWRSLFSNESIYVDGGSKYTLHLEVGQAWSTTSNWYTTLNSHYPGGKSDFHPSIDFFMRTYQRPASPSTVLQYDPINEGLSLLDDKMSLLSNGNVGIGTTTPTKGKVEIIGSGANYSIPNSVVSVNNSGSLATFGAGNQFTYSLYADGRISGSAFHAHSDMRIKNIQGVSDSENDLSTLMQIEITDYTLRDTIAKGKTPAKKVIAQQVADVFPQAVNTDLTEVVPDIYRRAVVQDGWIILATNLKVGERVKLITEESSEIYEVLQADPTRFKVSLPSTELRTSLSSDVSTLFVYGREVDDFHTVDYEAISMLNVSATQEQQRIIENQQREIEALRKRLLPLESRMETLEALLKQGQ